MNVNPEAPLSLGSLFQNDEDDSPVEFEQNYEITCMNICNTEFKIRQYSWHKANANKVWPGTFELAQYLDNNLNNILSYPNYHEDNVILELGAATGALSIFLTKLFITKGIPFITTTNNTTNTTATTTTTDNKNEYLVISNASPVYTIITSDIEDINNEIETNIIYNFELNNIPLCKHIGHTWGTLSTDSLILCSNNNNNNNNSNINYSTTIPVCAVHTVIASDILLYVR